MPGIFAPLSWLRSLAGSEIPTVADPRAPVAPHEPHPPVPPPESVGRALSQVGKGRYRLSKGGRKPAAPDPFVDGECDCSGFALAWCQGLDRYQPGKIAGDYLWTNGVFDDARGSNRMFAEVALNEAQPGDVVVYKGLSVKGVRVKIGHCGVIVAVNGPGWAGLDVVDCAGRKGAAIGHRSGALWGAKGGIVARRV